MFRRLGTLVWGALAAFHLWLLAGQAWNGEVDAAGFARWGLALGLAGALVALRRTGRSLFGDRRATAVWVLAGLLHGPALAEGAGLATQALAETPVAVAQLVCAAAGLALTLALAARGDGRATNPHVAGIIAPWRRLAGPLDVPAGPACLPRPPPVA